MILASDLDRTLIHPIRTLPPALRSQITVVEVLDGRPASCASRLTLERLRDLAADRSFVAVTTRSRDQLARLAPITGLGAAWAICANGGIVLDAGVPDPGWTAELAVRLRVVAPLAEARQALDASIGPVDAEGWRLRERTCDGLFLYSVCSAAIPAGTAQVARAALQPLGWTATLSGRKLYALPEPVTKAAAIEYVRARLGRPDPLVAAGDSELDRGLLEAADHGLVPRDSELATGGRTLPAHVEVTRSTHVSAAEELVARAIALGGPAHERQIA